MSENPDVTNVKPAPHYRSGKADPALVRAWEMLFEYDEQAVEAQDNFRLSRKRLVIVTFMSTTIAVLASWVADIQWLYLILGTLSFVLPVLASVTANIAQKFERISAWLKHRLVAERIRSEIYLYRMEAGAYATVEKEERDNLLNTRINEAGEFIRTDDFHAASENGKISREERIDKMYETLGEDDGHKKLNIENYISIRVRGQKEWYDKRVSKNYQSMRRRTTIAIYVQALGAILGALVLFLNLDGRFMTITTITNALSFAITSWTNVELIGQIYGIFSYASRQLSPYLLEWDISKGDSKLKAAETKKQKALEIVDKVEGILTFEREEWYSIALQTLSSNDDSLFQEVERLQKQRQSKQNDNANPNGITPTQ